MEGMDFGMYIFNNVSVLFNGSPIKEFMVGRGLRQGDHLSTFLFLLAVEGLSVLINKVVDLSLFEGYRFGASEEQVFHL